MIHLPASVRVYLCLTACDMRTSFDGLHTLGARALGTGSIGRTSVRVREPAARPGEDPVLGPGWICDLEQAAGGGDLRGAVRRGRDEATRNHGAGIRRDLKRDRSGTSS